MSGWKTIDTAPSDMALELSIFADEEYHALVFPCRRDGSGWRDVAANRPVHVKPTHWRIWAPDTAARASHGDAGARGNR
ncbi:MAG TPA: hypothetical protein VGJ08_03155 [Rhizomicrobium sp.]|jgi:hypothetical protein